MELEQRANSSLNGRWKREASHGEGSRWMMRINMGPADTETREQDVRREKGGRCGG